MSFDFLHAHVTVTLLIFWLPLARTDLKQCQCAEAVPVSSRPSEQGTGDVHLNLLRGRLFGDVRLLSGAYLLVLMPGVGRLGEHGGSGS